MRIVIKLGQGLGALAVLTQLAWADTAGPFEPVTFGQGIRFRHPEQRYEVNLRFRMQNLVEYTSKSLSDFSPERIDGQVRRLRLRLSGWAYDPRLSFQLQLSFSRQDMDWSNAQWPNVVRDANVAYQVHPRFQVALGQAKLPGNRQRVVSSGDLQFADRSIVNRTFNIDRDFGVQALWRIGALQTSPAHEALGSLRFAVSTGEGRNLPFSSNGGLGYVARGEWLPLGAFTDGGDYFEGDLAREPLPKISVGASVARFVGSNRAGGAIGAIYTTTGSPLSGTPIRRDQSVFLWDALGKWQGWSLYLEHARREAESPLISATQALFVGHGTLVQAGRMIGSQTEWVARMASVSPYGLSRVDSSNRRLTQWTSGLNYYIAGHRAKVQADYTHQVGDVFQRLVRLNVELGI